VALYKYVYYYSCCCCLFCFDCVFVVIIITIIINIRCLSVNRCEHRWSHCRHEVNSLLSGPVNELLLPCDWIYLPIISLYGTSVNNRYAYLPVISLYSNSVNNRYA